MISTLARHTRNLAHDPRAAILIDGSDEAADPLLGARLTLSGTAGKADDEAVRRRFLARHPEAGLYADFRDFSFWRLELESAHYIGGSAGLAASSIWPPADLLVSLAGAEALVEAEPGIVGHMSEDHADAIWLYARAFTGGAPGRSDPGGCAQRTDPPGRGSQKRGQFLLKAPAFIGSRLTLIGPFLKAPEVQGS